MNKLVINADLGQQTISKDIYGHFAEHLGRCIYEGLWVGPDSPIPNTRGWRNDAVEALKQLNIPNLRWPGGCFADTYHWEDGIGPNEQRPSIVNVHWGGTTENNHVGTHEFLDLCEQLDTEPYIAGNVGSGTVREMAEWLEYLTMAGQSPQADRRRANGREEPWPIRLWGVGNENWGCGGNMRPQYYADLYRQYANYCRHFGGEKLYKIACGFNDDWNEVLMREAGGHMDGLSIHYYTLPGVWESKGSATDFNTEDWVLTLQKAAAIEQFIVETEAIMDRYDPERRVGIVVDEWGTWFDVEPGTNPGFLYQQNTVRDALVAGVSLNVFNNHAERVHIANIAQTVNVLQAVVLTEGSEMLLTPTYHVFEMFKQHQNATLLPASLTSSEYAATRPMSGHSGQTGKTPPLPALAQISSSASRDKDGKILITLCNLHHQETCDLDIELRGVQVSSATGRVLSGQDLNTRNTFDQSDSVKPEPFEAIDVTDQGLCVGLPAHSVVALSVDV